jgi:hypothetical protein
MLRVICAKAGCGRKTSAPHATKTMMKRRNTDKAKPFLQTAKTLARFYDLSLQQFSKRMWI